MKKYLTFMAFAMTAVFGLVSISCSEEDDEKGDDSSSTPVGALVGDDAKANAAVANLRLAAVNRSKRDYRYAYDEKGNLETISDMLNDWSASAKDNFKIVVNDQYTGGWGDETYTFNISNNLVTSYSVKWNDVNEYGNSTGTDIWNFKYNAKGQLTGATWTADGSGSDGWDWKGEGTTTITYSADGRIALVDYTEWEEEDGDKYTYKKTTEYEYDSSSKVNKFYQYIPEFFADIYIDIEHEYVLSFAYVGLFGKSSSYVPTKSTEIRNYDGEEYSYTNTNYTCSFNSDGTLQSAVYNGDNNYNFTYTTVGTRSVFDTNLPVWRQGEQAKDKRMSRRDMIKSKREHRRQ